MGLQPASWWATLSGMGKGTKATACQDSPRTAGGAAPLQKPTWEKLHWQALYQPPPHDCLVAEARCALQEKERPQGTR